MLLHTVARSTSICFPESHKRLPLIDPEYRQPVISFLRAVTSWFYRKKSLSALHLLISHIFTIIDKRAAVKMAFCSHSEVHISDVSARCNKHSPLKSTQSWLCIQGNAECIVSGSYTQSNLNIALDNPFYWAEDKQNGWVRIVSVYWVSRVQKRRMHNLLVLYFQWDSRANPAI